MAALAMSSPVQRGVDMERRVVIFEFADGSQTEVPIRPRPEDEQHERAAAEREKSASANSPDHLRIVGFRFEWRSERQERK